MKHHILNLLPLPSSGGLKLSDKIAFFCIFILTLTIAPNSLGAQSLGGGTDNLSRFGLFSQELTPERLGALEHQTGMENPGKEQQTATHPGPDQTEENEKSKIKIKLTPPEKSTAEQFFARPETSVGQAVGGPALPKEEQRLTREEAKQKEAEQEALLAYLLSAQEKLVGYEKINLFLKLDSERRQKYLQQLPLQERGTFLKSLGEKGRYYFGDLQVKPVDRELKQFGYDFFENGTGGFTPDNQAPVGPDYVVGPGDTFVVSIWGNIDGSYEVSVDRSGNIVLPKVGAIHLWGQTFAEAKETIHRQVAKYFTNFQLNVTLGALRSIQVYIVGEVNAPGSYTVSSLSTVLSALVAAGGPAKTGSLRNVQLVRGGEVAANVDFYDFFLNGDRSRDARLQSGDTIHVPVVGSLVGLAGDLRHPAVFELKDGETLQDALQMAGGVISTAYLKRVQVERVVAHQKKMALDLDLSHLGEQSEANTFALQDRDLVKVAPISPASASYVVLEGYAARPGRYQFVSGMRLADLITPYDNLLPETFRGMAEILRLQPPSYQPEKLTIELGKALSGDLQQNIPLQEFDEVRLFSREEMEELPQVEVVGAVLNPGSFRLYKNMTIRDLVVAAGNVKRSAYLGEAELTRYIPDGMETRTERVSIDLDKALVGNPDENIFLQPYDHLVVRVIPDLNKRPTVEVKGKVLFPGTYTIVKGETLSSVLTRAGGFVDGAYLRGALFFRESAKEIQAERLEKLIFEQEQEASRAAADIATGALSPEEAKSAQTILASRKAIIDKLKQVPVTGRMVVHLAPLDTFPGSKDDFEVMDDDSITIPENPRSVAVIGQVYNPISLAYQPGKSVSYYISKVGGTTENANTDQIFIVRADGTVYSKQQAGTGVEWDSENHRWVFGGFNVTDLFPGDTVLVPEKIKKTDLLREIKDYTTIFYQLGLGAAAISVL
jgi:protein involved in polysaccharide export with SLBB domain